MNCKKCGHLWQPRVQRPQECPRCKKRLDTTQQQTGDLPTLYSSQALQADRDYFKDHLNKYVSITIKTDNNEPRTIRGRVISAYLNGANQPAILERGTGKCHLLTRGVYEGNGDYWTVISITITPHNYVKRQGGGY